MASDEVLAESWIARLAGVGSIAALDMHGALTDTAPEVLLTAETSDQIESIAQGNPVGLLLVAVAATRLVLSAVDEGTRHAVIVRAPRIKPVRELALCADIDLSAPVARFLGALHDELESAVDVAWLDRSRVIGRLKAIGVPATEALSQVAVEFEGLGDESAIPATVRLILRRVDGVFAVAAAGEGGYLPAGACALARCVAASMTAIAARPGQLARDVDILGPDQRSELQAWSGMPGPREFPAMTLVECADAAAVRVPGHDAVSVGRVQVSHRGLREQSLRAAQVLAGRGVMPGDRVALLMHRGPALILSVLSVLRAGASVVPLDPSHPPAQVNRQLRLSGATCVIRDDVIAPVDDDLPTISATTLSDADGDPGDPVPSDPDGEAALLFTSGSAGLPRPVALTHRQLAHKILTSGRLTGFDSETRCALLAAISSDALIYQIFVTLAAGGCVVPIESPQQLAPAEFWSLIRAEGVNTLNCTPSLLAVMAEGLPANGEQELRLCLLGGEAVPPGLLPRLAGRLRVGTLVNLYGLTEATLEAATFLCSGSRLPELATVPIGRPSPGSGVLPLTARGDCAPAGVPGELCVLGPGVAGGYLDSEPPGPPGPGQFTELPMYPGIRAFRTGDFGRWNAGGVLEFLGRADWQVRLDGNRVELREVEAAIAAIPGVQATAVVAGEDSGGAPALAAAYVSHPHLRESQLRSALAASVPRHMVPAELLPVEAIPLTPDGKVDRAAILARAAAADDGVWAPADEFERLVARAWTEVLGTPPRTADEDLFTAGGHSLTAAALVGRLCAEADFAITVRQVFAAPTPRQLSELLRTRARPADMLDLPMPWPAAPEPFPAGNHQRRMWFVEQYEEGDVRPYNMVEAYRMHGLYQPSALSAALDAVVRRHQALRTMLSIGGDRVDQVVLPPEKAGVRLQAICVPAGHMDETVRRLLDAEQRREFDLFAGPLLRAFWLTEDDSAAGVLLFSVHHSVCDGWSHAVILRDLLWFLDPQVTGTLPEAVQYGQYTQAMIARHGGKEETAGREFWRQTLAQLPTVDLPLDRRRPMTRSSAAGMVRVSMGEEVTARLHELCRELGISWFTGMVGAVRILLYRMCQARDIPLGCIVMGRNDPRLSDSVGMFANTVVLRTEVQPERGFVDLLAAMGRHADQVRIHDDFPFDTMVEEFGGERVAGRHPLFDVLVESVFPGIGQVVREASLPIEELRLDSGASGIDLAFSLAEGGPSRPIEVSVSYRKDILTEETAQRLAGQLRHLLGELVADPQVPVGSLPFLPEDQRDELLGIAVGEQTAMPSPGTLNELVQHQVSLRPDAPALICGGKMLTYAEIDRLASTQARQLAAAARTGPGQVVALVCGRTEWLVIGALAIVRTGSAFLPVDPGQPVTRISRLVADSGASAVLASPEFAGLLADCAVTVVSLAETAAETQAHPAEFTAAGPGDLAYLVYTSGSTGIPKGVLVEHQAILNSIQFRIGYFGYDENSRLLQVHPLHADAGISDVFTVLGSGASMVLVTRDQALDPGQVAAIVNGKHVTHLGLVPSVYELLLDYAAPALGSVRKVALGGERLTEALARRHAELLPTTTLYNEYGPTEDAVVTTVQRVGTSPWSTSIGRPIANKRVDLLDDDGELVPYGATGELCTGGRGLARGYHGDQALTAERFTANPSRPGERMYRTGDLARWLPNGCLEYVGRKDDQVKIRGNRVEPGEAAAVLTAAPGVDRAAVIAGPGTDGKMCLVAYVVGSASEPSLQAFARDRLPEYMIPRQYVYLPELPLNSIGKLDRGALPAPSHAPGRDEPHLLSPAEQRVADIWSAVLQKPVTAPDAAFFEVGGHSLAAARIAQELGVSVVTVFANQTVRTLAAAVAGQAVPDAAPFVSQAREPSAAVPLARSQRRVWVTSLRLSADVYVHSELVRTARRIDASALRRALTAVVDRQEILRAQVRARGGLSELTVSDQLPDGVPLDVVELPGADPAGQEASVAIAAASAVSFDLRQAPLFAIRLITGPIGGDLIVVTAHHLIYDAASTPILLDDLFAAYNRAVSGQPCELPPLSYTYRDWIAEEQEWLAGDDARAQERFWMERMAHLGKLPDPVGARRGTCRGRMGVARCSLSDAVLAPGSGTPFAVVVTAFAAALHRATDAQDLVLGFAASLRHRAEADAVVGFMANVMPLRLEIRADAGLGHLLSHATERIAEAYAHARLPFDVLAEKLSLRSRPGGSVLLDLGVSWGDANVQNKAYVIDDVMTPGIPATSDLWLFGSLAGGQLHLDLTYDDALINAGEADSLVRRIAGLVREVKADAGVPLDDLLQRRDLAGDWEPTRYEF